MTMQAVRNASTYRAQKMSREGDSLALTTMPAPEYVAK